MDPRKLAEQLLALAADHDRSAGTNDTLVTQVLIDGKWFNISEVETTYFDDSSGTSNVIVLKGVPA